MIKYCLQYLYLYPKLGMLDSNQRIQGSKPWALPLGEYPKYRLNEYPMYRLIFNIKDILLHISFITKSKLKSILYVKNLIC